MILSEEIAEDILGGMVGIGIFSQESNFVPCSMVLALSMEHERPRQINEKVLLYRDPCIVI